MFWNVFALLLMCILRLAKTLQLADISQCPELALRTSPATAAYDLRPDDFSMIMALGDRSDS
jgi:phospholipase B1